MGGGFISFIYREESIINVHAKLMNTCKKLKHIDLTKYVIVLVQIL